MWNRNCTKKKKAAKAILFSLARLLVTFLKLFIPFIPKHYLLPLSKQHKSSTCCLIRDDDNKKRENPFID